MTSICPNHPCPDCPVCDRVMAALQTYPGERVAVDDVEIRAGQTGVLIHLLHLWRAGKAAPWGDGAWSTELWPEHEVDCELIWEASS